MMNGAGFNLSDYYRGSGLAKILNAFILLLLILLIVAVPLPFGSVEAAPVFFMEMIAAFCFFLWLVKLVFCAKSKQLLYFRQVHSAEQEQLKRAPFFHRWSLLATFFRLCTFGNWPRKNLRTDLVGLSNNLPRVTYYSILGFPVRNTGLEKIALGVLSILVIQIIPWPHSWVNAISPFTGKLYQSASEVVGLSLTKHPISLNYFSTLSKLIEYGAYFIVYIVIVNASPSRLFFRTLLLTFLFSAGFQAAYGLVEFLSGHHHIFTYQKTVNTEYVTGTFINRNHFAAYLELSLPVLLSILFVRLVGFTRKQGTGLPRLAALIQHDAGKILFYILLLAVVVVGLVLSLSRGGIVFGFTTSILFFVLTAVSSKRFTRSLAWIVLAMCLFGCGIWFGARPLIDRFSKISSEFVAERSRVQLYRDTLNIFFAFPATGSGSSTFLEVFPMFQSFDSPGSFYRYAHNDYFQWVSETGAAGVVILVLFIVAGGIRIRLILDRNGPLPVLQIGIFCGLLACALHSFIEFGLQIPAVAMTYSVIAALFWRTPGGDSVIV